MPRAARRKDSEAIYHVMSRSISEFDLFPDDSSKEKFLDILQECKEEYYFRIYVYCLMTNHYHIIIDACGYDISKIMKSLNQRYVKYINKKYNRHGHLLAERFTSKIIDSSEYLLMVSAYIHNNPKDLPDYSGKEFEYPYSSMGIYQQKMKDKRGLIDMDYVLGAMNKSGRDKAVKAYVEMVTERRDIGTSNKLREYLEEFRKEQCCYWPQREVLLRNKKPEAIINSIAEKLGIKYAEEIMHRWRRNSLKFRRITAYILAVFCGMGIKEVSTYIHNISASCCANLVRKGFEEIKKDQELRGYIMSLAKA